VQWNHEYLGHLSNYPLSDPRTVVIETDIDLVIRKKCKTYDAILLDVDNGPEGLNRKDNNWLYSIQGLIAAKQAMKPSGIFALWSVIQVMYLQQDLKKAGFKIEIKSVRSRIPKKGGYHTIWLASQ
jgi:spermidine synthase